MMMDPPECPVCFTPYGGDDAIPRVLPCGHSACESCLLRLPQRFPLTIRCPACTQLVKYPSQGPTSLPKNIDLLRFCNTNSDGASSSARGRHLVDGRPDRLQPPFATVSWSDEFYATWRAWVLPRDAVSIEGNNREGEEGGEADCGLLVGRLGSVDSGLLSMRCRENQSVSLVPIVQLTDQSDDSGFKFDYVAWVLNCLRGMVGDAAEELALALRASVRGCRVCRVYGLWGNLDDGVIYLVCERLKGRVLQFLVDGIAVSEGWESSFALTAIEMCEVVTTLHKEGLVVGSLGFSSFDMDGFGHVHVDLNEVLVMGRKVAVIIGKHSGGKVIGNEELWKIFSELLEIDAPLSPEVLFELLRGESAKLDEAGNSMGLVGYGSDVWALSCLLIRLLIGTAFPVETWNVREQEDLDFSVCYLDWLENVGSLLVKKMASRFVLLRQVLLQCLNMDPQNRPLVTDVRRCFQELIIGHQFVGLGMEETGVHEQTQCYCLILGKICQMTRRRLDCRSEEGREEADETDNQVKVTLDQDLITGLAKQDIKHKDLQGHRDCVTGFAIGGGFLFSSSFDKTVQVWSLQDFSHVHSFRGHKHKIMAIIYVEGEQQLCVTGDSGSGIYVWDIGCPLMEEPMKKWYEEKDWRFSGIHALAYSSGGYIYTGSGDKLIKAWSMQDCTLSCSMDGHKSVVSSLVAFEGVLFSGSWDGTVRLWSLSDHSPLAVLGEDMNRRMAPVLSITADKHFFVAAYENGSIKVWKNDVYIKSAKVHNGAVFALSLEGKWLVTGGQDKTITLQELSGDESEVDIRPIGSIPCSSVITALLSWQGKLFVGCADKSLKVYYSGR